MAKRLQHRGGTTSQHSSFTGAVREVTVDTDKNTLVVHDGATAGGHPLATATNFTSTGIDDNATSTAITIGSNQNIGIGSTNSTVAKVFINHAGDADDNGLRVYSNVSQTEPLVYVLQNAPGSTAPAVYVRNDDVDGVVLHLEKGDSGLDAPAFANGLFIEDDANTGLTIGSPTNGVGSIAFGDSGDNDIGKFQYNHFDNSMTFTVNASERMRIEASGNVAIGTTTTQAKLHIVTNDVGALNDSNADEFMLEGTNAGLTIGSSTTGEGAIHFSDSDDADVGKIQYAHSSNLMTFRTNGANRMFIDSSGRVGIGTSSLQPFLVNASRGSGMGSYPTWEATTGRNLALFETDQSEGTFVLGSPTNGYAQLGFADPAHKASGRIGYDHSADAMVFGTNSGSERMRINSSGNVFVGKTADNIATAGSQLQATGAIVATVNDDTPLYINRLVGDGTLVAFYQATSPEGSITVSGATVSYNGFTGTHWSRFTDNSTPNILRGTVLESLDEMCDWYNLHFETTTTTQDSDGNDVTNTENHVVPHILQEGQSDGDVITYNHEGTDVQATIVKEGDIKHMKSKISDTVDAKNVYGVFHTYDEDGEGYNDFYVASVGSFVVRIKQGETVAKGDLLQSNGDGTAKVQTDDAIRASTFAKVLSTTVIETYEDGSYLVPCSLMC